MHVRQWICSIMHPRTVLRGRNIADGVAVGIAVSQKWYPQHGITLEFRQSRIVGRHHGSDRKRSVQNRFIVTSALRSCKPVQNLQILSGSHNTHINLTMQTVFSWIDNQKTSHTCPYDQESLTKQA